MPREVTPPRDCQGTRSSSRTWDKVSAPCRVCGDTAELSTAQGSSPRQLRGDFSAAAGETKHTPPPKKTLGKSQAGAWLHIHCPPKQSQSQRTHGGRWGRMAELGWHCPPRLLQGSGAVRRHIPGTGNKRRWQSAL